jgi:hypothetical protein
MPRWLKWLLVFLIIVLAATGSFFAGKYYWQKGKSEQPESQQKSASPSARKSSGGTQATNEYAGCWNTYTNNEVGYTLKYPCDWTVKEINEFSETIGQNVKYITITTPDSKYFLHFGVRKNGVTSFEITDRTGVGAGEFVQAPAEAVAIFGVNVIPEKLVFEGKTKEYFYNQPTGTDATAGCKFVAGFSYTAAADYATYDLTGSSYIATAKLILKSAKLL